jgi:ubiquinone/menaquinone biosynthesis C-methylase UbiE
VALAIPRQHDALRPSEAQALEAWAARVRADRAQVERCREVDDPADFYAPVADRFRLDPRREGDEVLDALLALARPGERWLDIGAGAGRYALPLALLVGEVVAVEPSPGMREALADAMAEHGVGNIRIVGGRWPLEETEAPRADVALMAHVGYDIEAIGPFLAAMERAAGRLCVAVLSEGAMTTAATLFWQAVHGEPRVALPALPELMTLLVARGRLPEVRLRDRVPPTFESLADLLDMARRQLWVRPGSRRDGILARLVEERAVERDGRWMLDPAPTRVGLVSWLPRD